VLRVTISAGVAACTPTNDMTADDYAAIAKKAARLVDSYEAHLRHREEVERRILNDPQDVWENALDTLCEARIALWRTPAPDTAAMLFKLELLTDYMAEGCDDFHEEVRAISDDAHRMVRAA